MLGGNNRNFVIFVALTILILVVWQIFVAQPQIEDARRAAEAEAAAQTQATPADPLQADIPLPLQPGATPTSPTTPGQVYATREAAVAAGARVAIETPRLSGSVNLLGARIDDLRLTDYRETIDAESETIVLLSPENGPRGYFAEFGWVEPGRPVIGNSSVWTAPTGAVLTPETPLVLTYDAGNGITATRTIAVDLNYMFTITDTIANAGAAAVTLTPYGRVTRLGEPLSKGWFILHEGMIGVLGDQGLKEVDYTALEEEDAQYEPATNGWLGITDKYWAAALIPARDQAFTGTFTRRTDAAGGGLRFQAGFLGTGVVIEPGASTTVANNLFAGAKEVAVVDGYDQSMDIERFELLIDWGWFYFITKPMFKVIDWLYGIFGNFGIAILLVTVLIKLIFFPLANRSYRSMAAMRKVTPQIQAMRERYRDDRPKQQQAMLELYRKEKINPIAGCWPILIQIPVFFSLYKVLFVTIEMRQAPFFGWIQDLSVMDPYYIWPVIMGITMWVQFQLNPQAPGTPRWIFHILPIVFTFMLSSFPAGLVIYWAWNNFLSVAQQSVIMTRNGVKVDLLGNIRGAFKRTPKKAEDAKAKS